MKDFITRFKIPTMLGLSIILLGLVAGVYLVLREQILVSQAAPNLNPQNIVIANITEDSAAVSWQTNSAAPSFVTFGQNSPSEQTALDDRDINNPKPHVQHYVTLKNLIPQTRYQFKVVSGKIASSTQTFETARLSANKIRFSPIIGSVLDNNTPLDDAIAYLTISDTITQSALIKTNGNFLIPLSDIRKADLSDIYPLTEGMTGKITIVSDKGKASLLLTLKTSLDALAPVKLGESIDLTAPEEDLDRYDLNNDKRINAADNAIILQNLGKNPQNEKADINKDGIVDEKDLELMYEELKI